MPNGAPEVVKTYPGLAVKVIAGLFSIVVLGGGVWAAHVSTEVSAVKREHEDLKQRAAEVNGDIRVLKERSEINAETLKDLKESQRELNRKIDELLRITPRR